MDFSYFAGVKFIFNNIDLKNPDEEYTFTVRLDSDRYNCKSKIISRHKAV